MGAVNWRNVLLFLASALLAWLVVSFFRSGVLPPPPAAGQTPSGDEIEDAAPLAGLTSPESTALRASPEPPSPGIVRGRVVGILTGFPRSGEAVRLEEPANPAAAFTSLTDASGEFVFEGIALMAWTVRALDTIATVDLTEASPEAGITLPVAEPITLRGTARDATAGTPVSGVRLQALGFGAGQSVSAQADPGGRFTLTPVTVAASPALGAILVEDAGWSIEGGHASLEIVLHSLTDASGIELRLHRRHTTTLIAVDPAGTRLPAAALTLITGDLSRAHALGVTGDDGALAVALPAGLTAWQIAGWHTDWPLLLSEPMTADAVTVEVVALETTDLEVTVVDTDGRPVPGAVVTQSMMPTLLGVTQRQFGVSLRPESQTALVTGERGVASFSRLPRCAHLLTATAASGLEPAVGESAFQEIDLAPAGETARVTLVLEVSNLLEVAGRVVDTTGEPVRGATVYVPERGVTEPASALFQTVTDGAGRFTLEGVQTLGGVRVAAAADGYAPSLPQTAFPGNPVTLTLTPEVVIRGRVTRASGAALTHFALLLWRPAATASGAGWSLRNLTQIGAESPEPSGAFEWHVSDLPPTLFPGPVWLHVMGETNIVATADLQLGAAPPQIFDLGRITMRASHDLDGRVLSQRNRPIEAATIQWEDPGSWPEPAQLGAVWRATSDAQGRFTLRALPAGHWRVLIRADQRAEQAFEIDIPATGRRDFVLQEETGADFTLRVTGAGGRAIAGAVTELRAEFSEWTSTVETDDLGNAQHFGVLPGPHRLEVLVPTRGGHTWTSERIDIVELGLVRTIETGAWLDVTAQIISAEHPARGAAVRLADDDQMTIATATTDETGRCVFRAPPGEYQLWAGHAVLNVTLDRSRDVTLRVE